ncbi:lipase family protein [Spongisporangium articulatum]|uniref:Lipase family protein n=1 Tax=Spongisporangium articulatum TaxID=3362603 RepID=A0ABW8AGK8_9ACTN
MPGMTRLLLAGVVATSGALVAVPQAQAVDVPVVSHGVVIPTFYNPPAALPAANGAIVRSEPMKLVAQLPAWAGGLPGHATRLMYKTTDNNGKPVAATAAYVEPTAKWKGPGTRPIVAVAPGTMGQGDQCAPSLALERGVVVKVNSLKDFTLSAGYEDVAVYRLITSGVAVVLVDYIGLGTTDRVHTYVDRLDEGHAVLDAVRAAKSLPTTSVTSTSAVGLYGYSQGGGAVASAAELQPSYAPDVNLKGTFAGAPPANLTDVTKAIDGSELAAALGWSINGFVQSDPSLQPLLDKYLNAAGVAALKNTSTMCVGDSLKYANAHSKNWTKTGQSISEIIAAEPAIQAEINKQRIGLLKPTSPVQVMTGYYDNLVPHGQARQLAVDWCAKGANVTYRNITEPKVGSPTVNHVLPLLTEQTASLNWLTARLKGKAVASNCWTMPLQP